MPHEKVVGFCEPNKCKVEVAPKSETDAVAAKVDVLEPLSVIQVDENQNVTFPAGVTANNLTAETVTGTINAEEGLIIPLSPEDGFLTIYTTKHSLQTPSGYNYSTVKSSAFKFSDLNTGKVKYSGNIGMSISYKATGDKGNLKIYKNGQLFQTINMPYNQATTVDISDMSVEDSVYVELYNYGSTTAEITYTVKI